MPSEGGYTPSPENRYATRTPVEGRRPPEEKAQKEAELKAGLQQVLEANRGQRHLAREIFKFLGATEFASAFISVEVKPDHAGASITIISDPDGYGDINIEL